MAAGAPGRRVGHPDHGWAGAQDLSDQKRAARGRFPASASVRPLRFRRPLSCRAHAQQRAVIRWKHGPERHGGQQSTQKKDVRCRGIGRLAKLPDPTAGLCERPHSRYVPARLSLSRRNHVSVLHAPRNQGEPRVGPPLRPERQPQLHHLVLAHTPNRWLVHHLERSPEELAGVASKPRHVHLRILRLAKNHVAHPPSLSTESTRTQRRGGAFPFGPQ